MRPKHLCLVSCATALLLAGCGGSTTSHPDPALPPAAAPDADVGRSRAERDAALASGERMQTQQRTEAAVGEKPQ
ncbi:MAG: hypothetical protein ABW136_02425 [Steroidobacteraceae bacterium]